MALELIKLTKGSSAVAQVGSFGFFKLGVEPSIDFNPVFSENTPQQIKSVSEYIGANNLTSSEVETKFGWKIGDTINITLTTAEVITVAIMGYNHYNKTAGGKAGILFGMVDCLAVKYRLGSNALSNKGGWGSCELRTTTLPTIKSTFPQEWQDILVKVDVKSANGGGANFTAIETTSDDLFIPAEIELTGSVTKAQNGADEGSVYEYWNGKTQEDRIKNVGGFANPYWLRSCNFTMYFVAVNKSGQIATSGATTLNGISLAFCV